jgi:hypothetical protein
VSPAAQRGVALIAALLMLALVALLSASLMRNALGLDLVAGNARSRSLAEQAALSALRYCERALLASPPGLTLLDAPADDDGDPHTDGPAYWSRFGSWHGGGRLAGDVPAELLVSDDGAFVAGHLPQCLAERHRVADDGLTELVLVTARGFSPDYAEDRLGRPRAGAVVWTQAILSPVPPSAPSAYGDRIWRRIVNPPQP